MLNKEKEVEVSVSVSDDEFARLESLAEEAGLSMADMVRLAVVEFFRLEIDEEVESGALDELALDVRAQELPFDDDDEILDPRGSVS